jgi:hypothetical protein
MKAKTIITEINHDDLVNLFSTATYGSNYFDVAKKKKDYYGTELEDENDCREDTWAKILLAGKPVYVLDYYSEKEAYGNLPHEWDEKRCAMRYTVTLEDIKNGIQKAIDNGGWDAECAFDLINDDACDLDLTEAENLLQIITFGEAIYG